MNQNVNDGVHAVRAVGQKVLERVESVAGDVAHEARDAGEKLAHSGSKKLNRKRARRQGRKRAAGFAASAASALAFVAALVMRKKNTKKS